MTDYKGAAGGAAGVSACASLPEQFFFFARFESSRAVEVQRDQELHCPFVLNRADVCKSCGLTAVPSVAEADRVVEMRHKAPKS